jgi:hypothetical protein
VVASPPVTRLFEASNRLLGWPLDSSTQIQIFDRTGRMLGFYVSATNATHGLCGFIGRANQLLRFLK